MCFRGVGVHWWITGMCFQSYCYLKTLAWHSRCVRHCCKHFANVKSFCPYRKPTCQVLRYYYPLFCQSLPFPIRCSVVCCWKHQHRVGIRQQQPWGQKGRPLTAHQLLNQTLFSPGDPYGWPSSKPLIQSIFFISREMI